MSLLAGSLAVAKPRSAPVRRAQDRGTPVRGGRVVVFLRGFRIHFGRDGEGLLGAAGLRVLRGLQDLGPVPVQPHRGGPQRAADLACGGGALDAVVAVGVVGGEAAELAVRQGASSAVWRSQSAVCWLVAVRASGPSCSRGRGVHGQ